MPDAFFDRLQAQSRARFENGGVDPAPPPRPETPAERASREAAEAHYARLAKRDAEAQAERDRINNLPGVRALDARMQADRLAREQADRERQEVFEAEQQQRAQAELDRLKGETRAAWIANGGTAETFAAAWPGMRDQVIAERTAQTLAANRREYERTARQLWR